MISSLKLLPAMDFNVFSNIGVNIFYLSETTNPEVLKDTDVTLVKKMEITKIGVKKDPMKLHMLRKKNVIQQDCDL